MKTILFAITALSLSAPEVLAHASFEQGEAAQGSTYKAVVRIGHGCGGQATNTLRVQIPEGVIAVKPMPKAGWELETVTGTYEMTYSYHGTPVTEGVTEIIWSGGDLPDAWYDEFVFSARLTEALPVDSTVFFPVVQDCADGSARWIEIPAEGQDAHDLRYPAPSVKITAPGHSGH